MIDGEPPESLTTFREGCELFERGEIAAASQCFERARELTADSPEDAFSESLRSEIDRRLEECEEI